MGPDVDRRYLTVISWPEGWDKDRVAALLASAIGTDDATVRFRLGAPPRIFALLPGDTALRGVFALQEAGGDAFTCGLEDLQAMGPTWKVKDLKVESGRLEVELWRGAATTIDPGRIDVAVRAKLSEEVGLDPILASGGIDATLGSDLHTWSIGGAYGLAIRIHAGEEFRDLSVIDKRMTVSHKLDLHTTDGRIFQIDGDKFGFRVLGELRGASDNVNVDRMCELMTHLAPEIVVDPYFEMWKPPPGYDRLRLPLMHVNDEDPAFAFYSRWSTMMYRHVMG